MDIVNICIVLRYDSLTSVFLLQHLASQRHKNILEGKPPKPRWSPYDRSHPLLRQSALLVSAVKLIIELLAAMQTKAMQQQLSTLTFP